MAREAILYLSDNIVRVTGLQSFDGSYINNATLTVTLKYPDGTLVTGQVFPTAMSYVAASNGEYRGAIEPSINVSEGDLLVAWIEIDTPSDGVRHIELPCKVLVDSGNP